MKILVLAPQPFFKNRGTPIATLKMLKVLESQGHDIDLLTYHEGSPVDLPGCHHIRIRNLSWVRNVPPGFSWKKLVCDVFMTLSAFRLCFRNEYHLIHAVEESVFIANLLKLVFGTPYIYDMDSSMPRQILDQAPLLRPLGPILRYFEALAVRQSNGVVAVCQSLEEVAASHCDSVPIVRIEDASLLTEQSHEHSDAANCDKVLEVEGRVLMYVGNLQSYQGIDLLLDAFTHVYHRLKDVQLVVIGGSDTDIRKHRSIAHRHGIADRTHFLGPRPVEQLGAYLEQATVLISPRTLGNNTPMKVYSYLESRTPVLATRLDMHTQVLDDEIAYLAEANPLDMARGICSLLDNKELRDRISNAAQERIQQQFCPELLDSKLSEFYQDLADTLEVEI